MDMSSTDVNQTAQDVATDVQTGNVEGLKDKFNRGKDAARRYASQAKDRANEYRDKTEQQIKDNPFWAMMIAMGVGLSVGMLISGLAASRKNYY